MERSDSGWKNHNLISSLLLPKRKKPLKRGLDKTTKLVIVLLKGAFTYQSLHLLEASLPLP